MKRLVAVGVLATVALSACAGGSTGSTSGSATTVPSSPSTASLLPADPLALPEFDFQSFQALLRELRGTPVVVNIWASWCGPCRAEAPGLARLAREFEGRVQFLGVDILDQRPAAREFITEFGWPYPSVFDPDGEIRDRLGFVGQPMYEAAGSKAFEWIGVIDEDILDREIRKVLGGASS